MVDNIDPSILFFVEDMKKIFEKETYKYSFYDYKTQEIKEKNKLYHLLEKINNNDKILVNDLKHIYDELNSYFTSHEITNISNIKCGKVLKYKNRTDLPIQLYNGYYYSFTVSYKKIKL